MSQQIEKTTRAEKVIDKRKVLNLSQYATYYLTTLYNKVTSGSSLVYRNKFNIGIVSWRIIATLASEPHITASQLSQITNIDKGSISRSFKKLHARGIISFKDSQSDARKKLAYLTKEGYTLHDKILPIALEREQTLLSNLEEWEIHLLFEILEKMKHNLGKL